MSKSIHTTVASTRRDNTRAELADPENADIASLAKKRGYKKSERRKRQGNLDAPKCPLPSEPGLPEA